MSVLPNPPPSSSSPATAKCGRCKTPAPDTSAATAATCFHPDQNTDQLIWNKWSGLRKTIDTEWQIILVNLCETHVGPKVCYQSCAGLTVQMCSYWLTVWLEDILQLSYVSDYGSPLARMAALPGVGIFGTSPAALLLVPALKVLNTLHSLKFT